MKKIVISRPGSYNQLKIEEFPDLSPNENELVIETKGIGVNYADVCVRLGVYESAKTYVGWPITPGFEASGHVMKVGRKVKNFKVGDEVVCITRFNAYASQICVGESQVLKIPQNFSLLQAAGFPAVFFTAYHAIYQHIRIRKGARVLIHSAAGGVGTALTQICRAEGFSTVGVIGSSHKKQYLEKFGPDVIIDKSKEDLWAEARKHAPEGYDVVFDANGHTTLKNSYKHLRPTGKLIAYGAHGMMPNKGGRLDYVKAGIGFLKTPRFSLFSLLTDNKGVVGFNLSYLFDDLAMIEECVQGLNALAEKSQIKPIPITSVPFADVGEAHKLIESGQSVGKIILTL